MNIYKVISKKVNEKINKYLAAYNYDVEKNILQNIKCEIPPKDIESDYALNMAMILARPLRKAPKAIAEEFLPFIKEIDEIKDVTIANPGFINLLFKDNVWESLVEYVNINGKNYGTETEKKGGKVNVEFISANPTGPLHIGHCRGAMLGNAMAGILDRAGFDVSKEYYINDYGVQINNVVKSVHFRYLELLGKVSGSLPEGCYPGEYIIDFAKELYSEYKDKYASSTFDEFFAKFKQPTVDYMMAIIKEDLARLNISFDVFSSEASLVESGKVEKTLEYLKSKDLIYMGVLGKPLGIDDEDWSPKEQLLFKSTQFGDDFDRVLKREDGSYTYFISDIAYHKNKYERGFTNLINFWGADHGGYVKRLKGAVTAVTDGNATLEVILCQMVNLEKNGMPFKMSKRKGTFVWASDVLDEVDSDILKLMLLSKSADSQMTFDFDKVKEESKDNIIFYINYAYGRTCSLQQKYEEIFNTPYVFDKKHITHKYNDLSVLEKKIIYNVSKFPDIVQIAAYNNGPHLVVEYIKELAESFHTLWSAGDRFINSEDIDLTNRNMSVVLAVQKTIESALDCLTIKPKRLDNQLNLKD